MSVTSTSLRDAVQSGDLDDLERVWLEQMKEPGPLGDYLETLEHLISSKRQDHASMLAGMLMDALASNGRQAEILPTLEFLDNTGLKQLVGHDALVGKLMTETYASESWFPFVLKKVDSTLDPSNVETMSWKQFIRLRTNLSYLPGKPVYHSSGWGEGVIGEIDEDEDEVTIRFNSGREHVVPWQTAVDSFTPLAMDDLRAMQMMDPDGLQQIAKDNPVEIVRKVLRLHRGKATSLQIKDMLADKVVPTRSWATWWKKAKKGAVEDPLIAVEGSASRPVLTIRKRALSLAEEARHSLRHVHKAHELLMSMQAYLDRCTRDSDRAEILSLAHEKVGPIATSGKGDSDTVEAVIWLEEHHEIQQEEFVETLRTFFGVDTGVLNFSKLLDLKLSKVRQRTIGFLPLVLGEGWHNQVIPHLKNVPIDCLEPLFDMITEEGVADALSELWRTTAPFPNKNPFLLFLLTKAYAEGAFDGAERKPDASVMARVIVHVIRTTSLSRKGSAEKTRLMNRIVTLLTGKRKLLVELLGDVDQRTIQSLLNSGILGGEEFPPKVQEIIERVAHEKYPKIFLAAEVPFWDLDYIYGTKAGIDQYEAVFHDLRDVKIPANSKAIGAAASLGDLSENAEWDAAMEEQRTLTARATEMEENLKRARLIAEQEVPNSLVAPGTIVTYEDLGTGESKTMTVLGPWDSEQGKNVVSYLAPLAKALLGSKVGDSVEIELPTGSIQVKIAKIVKI
jgi:transcription elongation GreA/GreB family factor